MSQEHIALDVSILYIETPVRRRIDVPTSVSFAELHHVLQLAFGWTNAHLHKFLIQKKTKPFCLYGERDNHECIGDYESLIAQLFGGGADPNDATDHLKLSLSDRLHARRRFFYHYDYMSDWTHVVRVGARRRGDGIPRVLDGTMACPPEDTAPHAYDDFVAAWRDERHHLHVPVRSWLERTERGMFHPDQFDMEKTNARLAKFWADEVGRRRALSRPMVRLSEDLPQLAYELPLPNGRRVIGDSRVLFGDTQTAWNRVSGVDILR